MIPLVAVGFRVMFMGGLIMWYSTSVWQTVDTYFRDEFKKHLEKYPLDEKIKNNVDDSALINLVKPDIAKSISNREKDQIKTRIEANAYSFKPNNKYKKKDFGLKIESDVDTMENINIPPEEKCDLADGSRDKEKIGTRLNPNFWSDEMDNEECFYITDDDMLQKSGED